MAIGDLVQQAVHRASSVPRLWSAALEAGTGRRGAVEVLQISQGARRAAAIHGTGVPGRTNAVRHFLWQALLTARCGRDTARSLATAQESGTTRPKDSEVDEHNNLVGQEYGAAHAAELRSAAIPAALERLVPVALEKWDAGELVWIRQR